MMFLTYLLFGVFIGWSLSTWSQSHRVFSSGGFSQSLRHFYLAASSSPNTPSADSTNPIALVASRNGHFNGLDDFYNHDKTLSNRLTGLKSALINKDTELNDKILEAVYRLLLLDKEICQHDYLLLLANEQAHHPDDLRYMLNLLEGKVNHDRLSGIAHFLTSEHTVVRISALRTIAAADCKQSYRQHIKNMENNDPDVNVRKAAEQMLRRHYQ